jgi:hypothetical protein
MKFTSIVCAAIVIAGITSPGHASTSVSAPVLFSQTTAPTGAYYEQNGSSVCSVAGNTSGSSSGSSGESDTADTCKIDFAATPAGKYLIVEGVSCNLSIRRSPLATVSLATASGIQDVRLRALEPTAVSQSVDFASPSQRGSCRRRRHESEATRRT